MASRIEPDVERSLIASCLADPAVARVLAGELEDADFGSWSNRTIWRCIRDVVAEGREPGVSEVVAKLQERRALDAVGGLGALLSGIADALPSQAEGFARLIQRRAAQRRLLEAAERIRELAEAGGEPDEMASQAEEALWRATRRRGASVEQWGGALERRVRAIEQGEVRPSDVRSGVAGVDSLLGGFYPGELTVVGARPSMGKSALLQQIAEETARRAGPVYFVSAEMSEVYVADRALVAESGLPSFILRRGTMLDQDRERLRAAAEALKPLPVYLDAGGAVTTWDIATRARRLHAMVRLHAVCVDYLGFLADGGDRPDASRVEIVGAMARRLKALATELSVPVIVAHQLNRRPESRRGDRPTLADLRDSGEVEQHADVVLLIGPSEFSAPSGMRARTIEVAKNRQGAVGVVEALFSPTRMRFQDTGA